MRWLLELFLKVGGFILDPIFRLIILRHKSYKFVDGNDGSVYLTNDYAEAIGKLNLAGRGIIYDNKTGSVIISQ
jgi:hypothetical protein